MCSAELHGRRTTRKLWDLEECVGFWRSLGSGVGRDDCDVDVARPLLPTLSLLSLVTGAPLGVDNRGKGPRLHLTEASSSTWPPPRASRQGVPETASELESPLLTQITPSPYVPGSEPTPFREVSEVSEMR